MVISIFLAFSFSAKVNAFPVMKDSYLRMNGRDIARLNTYMMKNLDYYLKQKKEYINYDPHAVAYAAKLIERILLKSGVDLEGDEKPDYMQHWDLVKGFKTDKLLSYLVNMINLGSIHANRLHQSVTHPPRRPRGGQVAAADSPIYSRVFPLITVKDKKTGKDIAAFEKNPAETPYEKYVRVKKVLHWLNPIVYLLCKPLGLDIYYRLGLPTKYTFLLNKKAIKPLISDGVFRNPNFKLEVQNKGKIPSRNENWETTVTVNYLFSRETVTAHQDMLNAMGIPSFRSPVFTQLEKIAGTCVELYGEENLKKLKRDISKLNTPTQLRKFIEDNIKGLDRGVPFDPGKLKKALEKEIPEIAGLIKTGEDVCGIYSGIVDLVNNPTPIGIAEFTAKTLVGLGTEFADATAAALKDKPKHTVAIEKLHYAGKSCYYFVTKQRGDRKEQQEGFKKFGEVQKKLADELEKYLPKFQVLLEGVAESVKDPKLKKEFDKLIAQGACGLYEKALQTMAKF